MTPCAPSWPALIGRLLAPPVGHVASSCETVVGLIGMVTVIVVVGVAVAVWVRR